MKYHYLMIKKWSLTNQFYLCKKTTDSINKAINYKGSGLYVNRLKKKYGYENMKHYRILIKLPYDEKLKFNSICKYVSQRFNIVESNKWLNLIPEIGSGGSMISPTKNRKRIYKNDIGKVVKINELNFYLNNGWKLGTPLKTRKKLSDKLKGKPAHNKGIKTIEKKKTKNNSSKEETYKKRSIVMKEITNRAEVQEILHAFRKPPITLKNVITGEIKTLYHKQWVDQYGIYPNKMVRKNHKRKNWIIYKKVGPAGFEPTADRL